MQVTMHYRWQSSWQLCITPDEPQRQIHFHFFLLKRRKKMIHLLQCLTSFISLLSAVDVKSWLVMFGFQLSNIIPGFPRHSLYFVEPPYELQATQHCENGQVLC